MASDIPIHAATNPDRVYVVLRINHEHNRVTVIPGMSGKRLPKFWPTWFKQILATKFDGETYRVEISGNRVNLSAGENMGKAIAMAQTAALGLYELRPCPLIRIRSGFRYEADWHLIGPLPNWDNENNRRRRLGNAQTVAKRISLPHGYELHVWDDSYGHEGRQVIRIGLRRKRGKVLRSTARVTDVVQLVELHYTLAAV